MSEIHVRGRSLTLRQLHIIATLTDRYFFETRTEISQRVCRALSWRQTNGRLWDMGCREVLRRLEQLKLIALPQPLARGARWNSGLAARAPVSVDTTPIVTLDFDRLQLQATDTPATIMLWNALVTRYHYLRSSRIVGRQLKQLVYLSNRPVACLGWGEAAWEVKARDTWIGWTRQQRFRNRHRVVSNVRFLILPWVKVPNLASSILGRSIRSIQDDWSRKYGSRPVLLETFVDPSRYIGTCYVAANWQPIGLTAGFAKVGSHHHNSQRPKQMLAYPLGKRFRQILSGARAATR